MIDVVAVSGYRSLREVVVPLGRLTVVTGANGTGKSSLYRALRLLADCGQGQVVASLAREGGLQSALWAGPATLGGVRRGHQVQGTIRKGPIALQLGIGGAADGDGADDPGYLVDLGLPVQGQSAFDRDPQIKREVVWTGPVMRPATVVARRRHQQVEFRDFTGGWTESPIRLPPHRSLLAEFAGPADSPELWQVRHRLRSWRFYDGFRADRDAPARQPHVGTRTPALADDGHDLAAAVQTIIEDGRSPLETAVADAFDGSSVLVRVIDGFFEVCLQQPGMLRPLRAAELSDGTLRYLLWIAALLSPEPPPLLVVNEPETSLHPHLLGPLARLVAAAARSTQLVVVTHNVAFAAAIEEEVSASGGADDFRHLELVKDNGETRVAGQGLLTTPGWEWGRR